MVKRLRPSLLATLMLAAALAGACRAKSKPQAYALVGEHAADLRAAFNADVGKVRILMLVAPT